jgi:DNA-binding MarR family transcriptional regulator
MRSIQSCGFAIMRAQAIISREVSAQGVGFLEWMVLTLINESPDHKLRRSDLAKAMGLTPSGVTRLLLPMEKVHLITRGEAGEDARERYSSLTSTGTQILGEITEYMEMKLRDKLHDPNTTDLNAGIRLLGSM